MKRKIAMTGYKIVPIDPDLQKAVVDCWEVDRLNLEDKTKFIYYPENDFQDYAVLNPNHILYDLIKFSVPYSALVYLRNPPRSGLGPVHIDSKRECALNIPVQVNPNDSFCFVAREECTERPHYEGENVHEGSKRYYYEPEKYDYYNVRQPCLLNTRIPHGFANFADTPRVLLSVCFYEPYDIISTHI